MLQELFRIPLLGWPVYGYGLMLVVGFLAAIEAGRYMARRCGIDPDFFSNAALLALVFGVAGARLSHVLENLDLYTDPRNSALTNLWNAVNISSGGLTFYGGFLLATPALIAYGWYCKVPIRRGMDVIAVCLMIGLGFGRIGCFLNGCCFGGVCTVPWAVTFPYASLPYETDYANGLVHPPEGLLDRAHRLPGTRLPALVDKRAAAADPRLAPLAAAQRSTPVHPAQLYSAFNAFFVGLICFAYFWLPHAPGRGFALMLLLQGPTRFTLELLRTEPAVWGPMSLSMVLGIGVFLAGLALWFLFGRLDRPPRADYDGGRHPPGDWRSWLAHLHDTQGVTGSNPVSPIPHHATHPRRPFEGPARVRYVEDPPPHAATACPPGRLADTASAAGPFSALRLYQQAVIHTVDPEGTSSPKVTSAVPRVVCIMNRHCSLAAGTAGPTCAKIDAPIAPAARPRVPRSLNTRTFTVRRDADTTATPGRAVGCGTGVGRASRTVIPSARRLPSVICGHACSTFTSIRVAFTSVFFASSLSSTFAGERVTRSCTTANAAANRPCVVR